MKTVMQSFTVQTVQLLKLRVIVLQTINSCETSVQVKFLSVSLLILIYKTISNIFIDCRLTEHCRL